MSVRSIIPKDYTMTINDNKDVVYIKNDNNNYSFKGIELRKATNYWELKCDYDWWIDSLDGLVRLHCFDGYAVSCLLCGECESNQLITTFLLSDVREFCGEVDQL